MATHDLRRPFKRPTISDQQKRREISLLRQAQHRRDAQQQARSLASSVLSLENPTPSSELIDEAQEHAIEEEERREFDVAQASRLKGPEARKWFAKQLMNPEWMIDVPDRLNHDWYVFARPAGKRCFLCLPKEQLSVGSEMVPYCIIFHQHCLVDPGKKLSPIPLSLIMFWTVFSMSLRRLGLVILRQHIINIDSVKFLCTTVMKAVYKRLIRYIKDGLLLYNRHTHYQTVNTPLVLVWKDENCSQYVIDTDSNGHVPIQQQVVLELQEHGKLTTSDDPPVVFGCLDGEFIQKSGLQSGCLLRFSISDGGLVIVNGKLEKADLEYLGKSNRVRAFADSYSKVMFQFMSRNTPLRISDLLHQ